MVACARLVALALGALIGVSSCTTVLGIDGDYQLAAGGGSATTATGAAGGGLACPEGMVAFERYCIDETEVSEKAYQAFVSAGEIPSLPSRCDGKSVSPGSSASVDGQLPVTQVSWCDAHGFCLWAGKQLCGRPGGGEAGALDEPAASAWYGTCSAGGANRFPYGDNYEPGACVDSTFGADPEPVGTASCATDEGVLDLVGNVSEWENACSNPQQCRARGGAFTSSEPNCTTSNDINFDVGREDVGFRCCLPRSG